MIYNSAPLPFQGQKRNFIKHFRELIKDEFRAHQNGIFIDAFGGSGLLSHNIKQIYPNARVIYNDYDGYSERLAHIDETNEIFRAINPYYGGYGKSRGIAPEHKAVITKILDDFKSKGFYIDWLTFSSVLFYGGSYAHNEEEFKKEKYFFSRVNGSVPQYSAKGYLEGVEIVRKDAMELIKEFDGQEVVLVLDPPYLQTDKAGYKCFWGLRDFLKLIRLVREPFMLFSSENSDILPYVDDRIECGDEVFKGYSLKQAILTNGQRKTDYMIYKSGVRSLF
ncbi:DNA adenine methylase [Campylobacter concisus]|uniref:DNA adenine methylase n=1 Tax=Campylobacter concisus TaxID=199 RepID=UPI0015E18F25|nr:DNA adenine methylase [Campylobacter concisus]DAT13751.1 MAG TPA: DNA adenine methylase [Caudoviricetes sp.]